MSRWAFNVSLRWTGSILSEGVIHVPMGTPRRMKIVIVILLLLLLASLPLCLKDDYDYE